MTHEQEEKAEAPFFKTGKHPTKKQMAAKMGKSKNDGYYRLTSCSKCGGRVEDHNYKLGGKSKCSSCSNKE